MAYSDFTLRGATEKFSLALAEVPDPSLKGLLRRVVSKIFRVDIKGWCSEFEARNAPGGPAGADASG